MSATRRAKQAAPEPSEATLRNYRRDAASIMRRYRQREKGFEEIVAERDRVIRDALKAGLPRAELAELFDLSLPRIDQIRTGRR